MKKTLYIICLAFAVTSCKETSKESGDATQENQETLNADAASATEKTTTEASAELRWMEKIADVDWIDNSAPDHKLIFGKPTTQGGVITGKLEEHFPGLVNLCKYEKVSEGVLNIHLLKTIRDGVEEQRTHLLNFKLQLLDEGNTLVINYPDGRTLSYRRSQSSNPQKEAKAETETNPEKINARLWMDKIAGDWKNVMNYQIVRLNNPVQQGDIIKGEIEMHEESFTQVFRYERVSAAEMKCKLVRYKIKGDENYTEADNSGKEFDFSFKTELLDDGNTLVLHHSNGKTYTYKR